jgi:hypothetical protein
MEKVKGFNQEGDILNFGANIYDARIGRRLSLDLKPSKQPGWST